MAFVLTFFGCAAYDMLAVAWLKYTCKDQARCAALASGACALLSAVVTLLYVHSPILVAAAVLGHMLGTWISVDSARGDSGGVPHESAGDL